MISWLDPAADIIIITVQESRVTAIDDIVSGRGNTCLACVSNPVWQHSPNYAEIRPEKTGSTLLRCMRYECQVHNSWFSSSRFGQSMSYRDDSMISIHSRSWQVTDRGSEVQRARRNAFDARLLPKASITITSSTRTASILTYYHCLHHAVGSQCVTSLLLLFDSILPITIIKTDQHP